MDLGSEEAAGLLVAEVSETVSTFIFKACMKLKLNRF